MVGLCPRLTQCEATQAAYNILRFQCCAHADTVELCLSLNGCTISTVPTSFNSTAELEVLIGLAQSCTPLIGAARKQPEGVFSSPSKSNISMNESARMLLKNGMSHHRAEGKAFLPAVRTISIIDIHLQHAGIEAVKVWRKAR